eukprot:TRINITY_DN19297_c0_g1_i3.p1 TRINITY_DN19297_c0_g1~~TRINITY_DN19297_c0_g1_i3.p1  ORF type:complete len:691 (+),score=130.82 TRINITY_DN19297_c0_g1_i3:97-2169(+)
MAALPMRLQDVAIPLPPTFHELVTALCAEYAALETELLDLRGKPTPAASRSPKLNGLDGLADDIFIEVCEASAPLQTSRWSGRCEGLRKVPDAAICVRPFWKESQPPPCSDEFPSMTRRVINGHQVSQVDVVGMERRQLLLDLDAAAGDAGSAGRLPTTWADGAKANKATPASPAGVDGAGSAGNLLCKPVGIVHKTASADTAASASARALNQCDSEVHGKGSHLSHRSFFGGLATTCKTRPRGCTGDTMDLVATGGTDGHGSKRWLKDSSRPSRPSNMRWTSRQAAFDSVHHSMFPDSVSGKGPDWSLWILRSSAFEACISMIILVEFLLLGIDAQQRLHPETLSPVLEKLRGIFAYICTSVYSGDLALRVLGFGLRWCLQNPWVRVDMLMVALNVVDLLLSDLTESHDLILIRLLRTVRIARLVRVSVKARTLWLLISGLAHSAGTIFWTLILIFGLSYTWAVLGMEALVPSDPADPTDAEAIATAYFGNLSDAMLTLMQILILDNVEAVCRPLITNADTRRMSIFCAFYFIVYIFFVSVALMNLVTAVMVEGSLTQAAEDKEYLQLVDQQRKHAMLPEVRGILKNMSKEVGADEVSLTNLELAPEHLKERLMALSGTTDPAEVFSLLDSDNIGTLGIDDFIDGLWIASKTSGLQDLRMLKVIRSVNDLKHMLVDYNKAACPIPNFGA